MTFEFKDILTGLALVISSLNLYLYFQDIMPKLKLGFYSEDIFSDDDEMNPTGRTKYFSLDVVNHSSRRIKVANVSIEYMRSRWFSIRKRRENYPYFQKGKPNSFISSFWIEPWGDKSFSVEEENLTTWLWDKTHYSKNLWIRVVATDALGKQYKSRILKI